MSAGRSLDEATSRLSEAQLAELVRIFRYHDVERRGLLSYDQFVAAVRRLLSRRSQVAPSQTASGCFWTGVSLMFRQTLM